MGTPPIPPPLPLILNERVEVENNSAVQTNNSRSQLMLQIQNGILLKVILVGKKYFFIIGLDYESVCLYFESESEIV